MKRIFCIVILVCSLVCNSQEEKQYMDISNQFRQLYNDGNYEKIFDMFNMKMQSAVPIDKTKAFLMDMKSGLGEITSLEFYKLKDGIAHIYKATFTSQIRDIMFSLDEDQRIAGLLITSHKPDNLKVIERNLTKMILPFNGEWFVFWGGLNVEQNYHVSYEDQKYAYDILKVKEGASYIGDPKNNNSYFAFGETIIAPCDAKVVKVIEGVKDNIPGELNPKQLTGNTIVLKTTADEYILFAHLKQNSIVVKEGDTVIQGEKIAECGNSGNTTEPHLHLSLQNTVDMEQSTGAKLYFDKILVNGILKNDYIPIKEDFVKNIDN